jgi:DHA1 family tetracycline resistance protein-like MFS transporter
MCKPDDEKPPMKEMPYGVILGALSIFTSVLGAALTFPFLQSERDRLECGALCYGSMQSTRSGLTLIGTMVVGRLSDKLGRQTVLYIGAVSSILSYSINYGGDSINVLWIALVPAALLNHNFSVLKALFADYSAEYGHTESQRAASMGKLGMAVGVSFMLGPVIGANFLSNYREALIAAICLSCLSVVLLFFLPPLTHASVGTTGVNTLKKSPVGSAYSSDSLVHLAKDDPSLQAAKVKDDKRSFTAKVVDLFYLPVMQSPGAKMLLFMRFFMALAFNIFMTVWTVSLKTRFDFGPKDHALFMGWIGLCYALSQGVLANLLIKMTDKEDSTMLLVLCTIGLSIGRVMVMWTTSIVMVYAIMAIVIVCLGVMNTAMAAACSRLADADQIGGLYGVMESIESLAGLFGPTLGGLLFHVHPQLPLASVVFIYVIVLVVIVTSYRSSVVQYQIKKEKVM